MSGKRKLSDKRKLTDHRELTRLGFAFPFRKQEVVRKKTVDSLMNTLRSKALMQQEAKEKHENAQQEPQKTCPRCGSKSHTRKECTWTGVCNWCKRKDSHKENQCRDKKAGKPQLNFADVQDDDGEVNVHVEYRITRPVRQETQRY